MTATVLRGPGGRLRAASLAVALLLHALAGAALFWPATPEAPQSFEAVPLLWANAPGEEEEGAGTPPPAPSPAVPASQPVAEAPPVESPADVPEAAAPEPQPEPVQQAEAPPPLPLPPPAAVPPQPEPAELALPLPAPPPPAPRSRPPPSPQRAAAPAPAGAPVAAEGAVRLSAGTSLNAVPPAPDVTAARPRDIACSEATEYPPALRAAGIGGDVVLRLRLTDKGRVIEARVTGSSGQEELDEAARRGVRRCRFEPAMRDGKPIWSNMVWRVSFRP